MLQYLARESQESAEPGRDVLQQQMEAKVQREKRVSGSPAPPSAHDGIPSTAQTRGTKLRRSVGASPANRPLDGRRAFACSQHKLYETPSGAFKEQNYAEGDAQNYKGGFGG